MGDIFHVQLGPLHYPIFLNTSLTLEKESSRSHAESKAMQKLDKNFKHDKR